MDQDIIYSVYTDHFANVYLPIYYVTIEDSGIAKNELLDWTARAAVRRAEPI